MKRCPTEKWSPVKNYPKKRSLSKEWRENWPKEVEQFFYFYWLIPLDDSAHAKRYSTFTPQFNGPRNNILQKLFSVIKILRNLNDFFIFIKWFHYTHKNMLDVHLTILHAPNYKTLKESKKVCCRVFGFHRLITSENSTHTTMLDAHPKIFCFWVFRDHFSGDQFYGDHFSRIPLNFVWIR